MKKFQDGGCERLRARYGKSFCEVSLSLSFAVSKQLNLSSVDSSESIVKVMNFSEGDRIRLDWVSSDEVVLRDRYRNKAHIAHAS